MATVTQQAQQQSGTTSSSSTTNTSGKCLTPAALKKFEFDLSRAKTQIVLNHPFWAVILLKRKIILTYDVPTASMDGHSQIRVNPYWAKDLTVGQLQFLLCHEVGHEVLCHLGRRGARSPGRWNTAADAVINDTLKQCKVGEWIDGGVDMPGSMGKTTDAVYASLPEGDGGPGGIGQDIDDQPMTPEEADAQEGRARVELAQAAQAAKMQGKLPGVLEKFVADLLAVKTPWYEVLEHHMVKYVAADYTWARPNRRFISGGNYLPSTGQKQTMGEIVLQVDVSGSVTPKEMQYYAGHFARIVEECAPERVHVIYTDTQVQKHVVFEQGEDVCLEYDGCGGTDMFRGILWCEEQGIDPDVFITVTDGFTPWGDPPSFPVIWCISSTVVAPYGETVHFEME